MRGRRTRIAAWILGVLACTAALSAQITPIYQVVVGLDPVAVDVAVTDRQGKAVSNLSREDFVVYEDGEPQELAAVDVIGMPYSILLLVDRSARDEKSDWPKFVIKSVDLFLKSLRGPDKLAVAAFDDRVAVLVDWRRSKNGLVQKVMLKKSPQPTKFFEAVTWASGEMQFAPAPGNVPQPHVNGRRGVIVFTDGRDSEMYPKIFPVNGRNIPDPDYAVPISVETRFAKSRQMLQQGTVPFYFVAVDTDMQLRNESPLMKLDGWVRFLKEVRFRIEDLAVSSGGDAAYPKRIEDLLPFYEKIQQDLGTGYHITYSSRRPADGKARRIEVRVKDAEMKVYQSTSTYIPR